MVEVVTVARLLGGVVLLGMNAFFVASEFAMTRVPQFPEEEFQGHSGLERAWKMTDELEVYLSGCQVGITIASVGLGFVAEPAVAAVMAPAVDPLASALGLGGGGHTGLSVVIALALINILHVVLGEQTPTYLGVEKTKVIAKYLAPLLYWWTRIMSPVIRFADWAAKGLLGLFGVEITRSWQEAEEGEELDFGDLRSEMGHILSRGQLSRERRQEVLNALEISERPVSDILIPRDEMVLLSTHDDPEATLKKMQTNPQHSRFPLFDDEGEELLGIVYVPTVLANLEALQEGRRTFEDIATPPLSIEAGTSVSQAIDRFQAENQEMAVVVEEDRVVGLVTASDAFEAIAGDLEDPLDLGSTGGRGGPRTSARSV